MNLTDQSTEENIKAHFPVLVVEDNPIARKYLERKLVIAGYSVISASNGADALRMFDDQFFPIVLTDWMMPEMDGLDLCKAIRKKETERYVFIVLLTARDRKEDIIEGLEAGADDYLTKPVNHAELVARLNSGMRILKLERYLKEANEKIKELSVTDPLTGCFNRGYMNKKLVQELVRGKRYQRPLSLVFCDIDFFKQVNDTYGHQAGDEVLKQFTACIRKGIRMDLDWLTRYGGEEFLIVLPETSMMGAANVAERIRQEVRNTEIRWQDQVIPITSSFGVSSVDNSSTFMDITPETLISQADKALYASKNNGRDRVSLAD